MSWRWYIEFWTLSRPLEVPIKEHRHNLAQSLLEKFKISPACVWRGPQNVLERSEGLADWTEHHIQEIQRIRSHVSAGPSDQSTQSGHLSHLESRYHKPEVRKLQFRPVWIVCENCYIGTIQRIRLFCDDFYSDSALILTTSVKQCTDRGARPRVCGVFILMFLVSVLTLAMVNAVFGLYIPSCVAAGVRRR
jgi:hypothetical protein